MDSANETTEILVAMTFRLALILEDAHHETTTLSVLDPLGIARSKAIEDCLNQLHGALGSDSTAKATVVRLWSEALGYVSALSTRSS
jgi:hypothetical protein